MRDKNIQQALETLKKKHTERRKGELLVLPPEPEKMSSDVIFRQKKAINELLQSSSPDAREAGIRAAKLLETEKMVEVVVPFMKDKDSGVRFTVAEALVEAVEKDERNRTHLQEMMDDEDLDIQELLANACTDKDENLLSAKDGDQQEEWLLSPTKFKLNENFTIQIFQNNRGTKILLEICPVTKSRPKLMPVNVTFFVYPSIGTERKFIQTLEPSENDPSWGKLVFDLGDIADLGDGNITIILKNEQFDSSLNHRMEQRGD